MLNPTIPPPQVIARSIPRCPTCSGRDYRYVAENTEDGFRLRELSCEGCNADILDLYRRTTGSGPTRSNGSVKEFLLVVSGALVIFIIVVDGLF